MSRTTRRKLRRLIDRLEYALAYLMIVSIVSLVGLAGIQFICKYSDGIVELFHALGL